MVTTTPTDLSGRVASVLATIAVVIVAVSLALVARVWAGAPPHVGAPAPAFALPVVANGTGTVSLNSLRGHTVYLNFFATWCQPCKQEVPYISKLSRQFSKHNVVVIGVDELESADKVKQFAQQYNLAYKLTLDNNGSVGGDYGLLGLPLHVFIAPNGSVAVYRVGEMSEAQVRAALQEASQ